MFQSAPCEDSLEGVVQSQSQFADYVRCILAPVVHGCHLSPLLTRSGFLHSIVDGAGQCVPAVLQHISISIIPDTHALSNCSEWP